MKIASFITPHGFGHAARQTALLGALQKRLPELQITILGKSPVSFFEESLLDGSWTMQDLETDIGLVQIDPLKADLRASIEKLKTMYPLDRALVQRLAGELVEQQCQLVVADIAPLGLAVARLAGLPSVLVENFTWDWIYQPYQTLYPEFGEIINQLKILYSYADYHIKTEPWCLDDTGCFKTPPISRPVTLSRSESRKRLGAGEADKVVLITQGGTEGGHHALDRLSQHKEILFVMPGGTRGQPEKQGNLILLPRKSHCYHPNLINTSDAVIGKLGYSTIAEIHQSGIPYGYIRRGDFRESEPLAEYVEKNMSALHIRQRDYETGDWVDQLPDLLSLPGKPAQETSGADIAAEYIEKILTGFP